MAMVGFTSQIVELDAQGNEITRFGQAYTGNNNSSVPFDSPSGVAFLGTGLVIANQSYFADNPSNQALLDLETGEPGAPVYMPQYAGEVPPKAKPRQSPTHTSKPKHKHKSKPTHKSKPKHTGKRRSKAGHPRHRRR
jgi:hypothetical protein